ncbi:MAG: DEAD/DEAH box helicase [Chitinophagales bacterium]
MSLKAKPTSKIGFCLHPENCMSYFDIFSILVVEKNDKFTNFHKEKLDANKLNSLYKKLDPKAYQTFDKFTTEHIKFRLSEQTKIFKKQQSGSSLENYLQKAFTREIYESAKELLSVQENTAVYHRIINPKTGNYLITNCRFSESKPVLSFEVIQLISGTLAVQVFVEIDNEKTEISHFNHHVFLLEKENVYYFLNIEDAIFLSTLEKLPLAKYGADPALFMQHVVKRIEQKYTIDKHDFFEKKIIETTPVNCVYLSEVNSGSFLMITPQWKYDDISVEGSFNDVHETTINGEIYCVQRNQQAETDFVKDIKNTHPNFAKQMNSYFYLPFDEAKKKNWFLKFYHQLLDKNIELIGMDMLQHFRYSPFPVETNFEQIQTLQNLITAKLSVSFGEEKVPLNELQKTLFNHQRSVLLKDNSIGILDDDWMAQYATIIKHSKIDKDNITIPKWLLMQTEEISKLQQLKFVIDNNWWQKWKTWQQIDEQLYELPTSINATLRAYQHKGYEWLRLLSEMGAGACLADDMGLGKTIQTICFIASQYEKNPDDKFIIVCPSSLIYNWKTELEKFFPTIKTYVHYGAQRKFDNFFKEDAHILITPYSTLRVDVELIKSIFWNTIVLDESHNIKTLYAQATKAVYEVIAKNKIALSGTPIMNNTFDLYAQLNYLLPSFLGTQEFFRNEYALPIDRNRSQEKMDALAKLTAPFILRRTKQQVATDLPEKTELTLWCEMNSEQREAYETIKSQIKKSIFLNIKNEGLGKSKLSILQGIIKLRQICCSPTLLNNKEIQTTESIKIEMLMEEILNNLSNNKVLVFSQFKGMLHLIADELRKNKISFYHFDGDTAVAERQELVAQFQQEDNKVNVFLMSLKTGNAGINLTAADYVFLVDPWWNTAVQQQAIDRTHRIGQTKNVFAYKMICKDTIEEKIIQIQNKKQQTSDAIIVEDENFVKNLTQEDIAFLFD